MLPLNAILDLPLFIIIIETRQIDVILYFISFRTFLSLCLSVGYIAFSVWVGGHEYTLFATSAFAIGRFVPTVDNWDKLLFLTSIDQESIKVLFYTFTILF